MPGITLANNSRVLVVGEKGPAQDALCAVLEDAGHHAVTARFGDALGRLEARPPCVVVVDVDALDGPGISVVGAVARRGEERPYLIAVCPDDERVIEAALAAGCDECTVAPVRRAEFAARVAAAMKNWANATRASVYAVEAHRREATVHAVFGDMMEGLLVFDDAGRVVETNPAMVRLTGRPVRDLVGSAPPLPWWQPDVAADADAALAAALEGGTGDVEAAVQRPDGLTIPVTVHVVADRAGGRRARVALVRDLTDQTRSRVALQSSRREQASLRRLAAAVAGEPDTERVFSLISSEMGEVFGVECGIVVRFVNDVAAVVGVPSPGAFYSQGAVMPAGFDAAVARAAANAAPARVAYEYLTDSAAGAIAREAGVVCSVAAPISVKGTLWGAVLISTRAGSGIGDERSRLAGFGEMAGLALESAEARLRLEMAATLDELTGLPNRRAFDDALVRETERARRHGRPLALAMFDIDRLGQLNAAFGQDVGDDTIARFATVLTDTCRLTDLVARTGGAEFACLMPDTTSQAASTLAERVRRALVNAEMPGGLTCSVGVAGWRDVEDPESLVARAGAALYQSKHQGRDRISVAGDDTLAA